MNDTKDSNWDKFDMDKFFQEADAVGAIRS